jgi:hypothetical protein
MRFTYNKIINNTSINPICSVYFDKFIQKTRLSAHNKVSDVLEWIPYGRLYGTKYISESKFSNLFISTSPILKILFKPFCITFIITIT